MDLDLNQELSESALDNITGVTPLLDELDIVHEQIEERIRQLEAVTSRIRQHHTRQQNASTLQIVNNFPEARTLSICDSPQEIMVDDDKARGKDGTYLIAKALSAEKAGRQTGGYFDCNICLEGATDPVLTCCGHLFCWPCFYQLPCSYSNVKECPVCEGEVNAASVLPIYGNESDSKNGKSKLKCSDVDIPSRPQAKRIEGIRQKVITRGSPFLPVEETIQEMRRLIDAIGEGTLITTSATDEDQQNESNGVSGASFLPLSSFSSTPSSSLASTERFSEIFDEFINDTNHQESFQAVEGDSISSDHAVALQNAMSLNIVPEIASWVSYFVASSRGFGVAAIVMETDDQPTDTGGEAAPSAPSSLSSRRSRATDLADGGSNRRSRRRRLR